MKLAISVPLALQAKPPALGRVVPARNVLPERLLELVIHAKGALLANIRTTTARQFASHALPLAVGCIGTALELGMITAIVAQLGKLQMMIVQAASLVRKAST